MLDKRLNAYRDDLADERLRGEVDALRFTSGTPATVTARVADLLGSPDAEAGILAQCVLGDWVRVLDRADGFAWVVRDRDGYVGFVCEDTLGKPPALAPTHMVRVPRTFPYRDADLKSSRRYPLSMGSALTVTGEAETRGTRYLETSLGFVVADHLVVLDERGGDWVGHAETLLHTPYLWGGETGFGVDCSGLIALAMRVAGRDVVRDSDMQGAGLGEEIDGSDLARGDLVFWRGHVGVMNDADTLLHANGNTMSVAMEPLSEAVERIAYLYGRPTGYRRP